MSKLAVALFALLFAGVAQAAQMYRVDLDIEAEGEKPDHALMLLEEGKPASMEVGDPAVASRRYELRVDATEDEKGITTGSVYLRVVHLTPGRERVLGKANVPIARIGRPVVWQPRRAVKGLAIKVTLYRQPF